MPMMLLISMAWAVYVTTDNSIRLAGNSLVIRFPKNPEFNRELRRITSGLVQFDYRLGGYRMDADELEHSTVRESLRGFARRHGLSFRGEACVRAGAFLTANAVERVRAEIRAIENRLRSTRSIGSSARDENVEPYRDQLGVRRRDLYSMRGWPRLKSRPAGCGLVTPGSLVRIRHPDGEEGTVVVSAVELDGYERVSPFAELGQFLTAASVGEDHRLKGGSARTVRVVAVDD
ncbi:MULTISPECIES: hypothetical protein [unclassified Streptosporangium]|uniref:hypothetical protein n=1 Tax=unclassified Streptosporangium TaxID=2632669 RepID=UPI002E2C0F41|nr:MULTISPECIES: hypothetical protein [unclassified Streptosporangium]